ncbi:hypothetical protein WJX72_002141 [[Myrmecia] bisecta]|uniref:Beta-glucanase n=1 Tax=[Myrmecia] bisecta TaxID=41462 RepID=A0AAW1QQ20_9CHLO
MAAKRIPAGSLTVLGLMCSLVAAAASPEAATFVPGSIPRDTGGNGVQAHDGGLLLEGGKYYWYGTSQKMAPSWLSEGVQLYSSPDLSSWTSHGMILPSSAVYGIPRPGPIRVERAKILHNHKTGTYVMLFHCNVADFAWPSLGVATASSIYGPFQFKQCSKPDGRDSYDLTAWQDDNGDGFLVHSVENSFVAVRRLSSDYTTPGPICARLPGDRGEAPAVFKVGSTYYIITSGMTGWLPNPTRMFKASSMCGSWVEIRQPAVGDGGQITFNSQPTFVFPYKQPNGAIVPIYMGDRWNYPPNGGVNTANYVWLPMTPAGNGDWDLTWHAQWRLGDFSRARKARKALM